MQKTIVAVGAFRLVQNEEMESTKEDAFLKLDCNQALMHKPLKNYVSNINRHSPCCCERCPVQCRD